MATNTRHMATSMCLCWTAWRFGSPLCNVSAWVHWYRVSKQSGHSVTTLLEGAAVLLPTAAACCLACSRALACNAWAHCDPQLNPECEDLSGEAQLYTANLRCMHLVLRKKLPCVKIGSWLSPWPPCNNDPRPS